MKQNVIQEKSFEFSVRIINLYKYLITEKKEFVLSKQILRSGTSIGANIEEGLGGFTDCDFVYKLQLSYKETRETIYWLKLLHRTDFITKEQFDSMIADANEIQKILSSIILTKSEKLKMK